MTIKDMQVLCRDTFGYVIPRIKKGIKLIKIREMCENYLLSHGADSFWYWDVGAFVFSGTKTVDSISGKNYITDDVLILENDIITIDLSPQNLNIWGDYARTIIVQNGSVCINEQNIINDEWRNGVLTETYLHNFMMQYVTEDTTFEELYDSINTAITHKGYVNLDSLGNLGHSIEKNKENRIYIERGNKSKLSAVEAFTFEPHISALGSAYGYKMENIYSFENDIIIEL